MQLQPTIPAGLPLRTQREIGHLVGERVSEGALLKRVDASNRVAVGAARFHGDRSHVMHVRRANPRRPGRAVILPEIVASFATEATGNEQMILEAQLHLAEEPLVGELCFARRR